MTNNRASLTTRLLVWVLASVLGGAGLASSGLLAQHSNPVAVSSVVEVAAAPVSQSAAPAILPQVGNASNCNPAAPNPTAMGTPVKLNKDCIDLLVDKYCPTRDNPDTSVDEAAGCDPNVFLPASRWKDRLDNIMASQPGGWGNLGESIGFQFSATLGGFFMSIAGLLWSLIFGVAGLISSMDLLSGAAGRKVNETFVALAQTMSSSGLIALVFFITAVVLIRQILRVRAGGMPNGIISTIMTMVLPLALLFSITAAGATTTTTVDGKVKETTKDPSTVFMSPVWLAKQGIRISEMPSAMFGKQFSTTNPAFSQDKALNPSCAAYTSVLIEAYEEAWARKHPNQSTGASMAVVVNGLWNEAFMTFYNDGQFQNSFSGQRIVCHMLDGYSGITPAEQAVVAAAARYPAGANAGEVKSVFLNGVKPGESDLRYFAPYVSFDADFGKDGMNDKRKYVLPWAACAYRGGSPSDASAWALDPAWYHAAMAVNENDAPSGAQCAKFWTGSDADLGEDLWTLLRFKNSSKDEIRGAQADFDAIAGLATSQKPGGVCGTTPCIPKQLGNETLSGFSKTVLVTKGEIGGWLFSALMALIAALMYTYVLGGMFAGLLVAKIGFVVLLAVLPGILLMLAIPNVNGRKNSRAMKLLRTLIGWMVSSALISVIIMVFALFIMLIRQFLGSPSGGMIYIISPALSLVLLHFMMKAAGLGSLLSPTGALGLATGAAAAASSGNMKDLGKGQKGLQGMKKKGEEFAHKRQQRKQRADRIRNSSRKQGGKSYKDMLRDDPEFARKNAAAGFLEARRFKKAAEKGKGDAAEDAVKKKLAEESDKKAKSDKEESDKKAKSDKIDDAEKDALDELDAQGNPVKNARDQRTGDRLNDLSQADELAAAKAATAGADGAFDALMGVKANADLLGDVASTDLEASARVQAGEMVAAGALAAGHLDADDSRVVVSQAASLLETSDPGAHRDLIAQNAAAALGLVSATGGVMQTASGTPVLGFQNPVTGEMITPHTTDFSQMVALAQAAHAGGALGETLSHNGVEYRLSSAMGSIGEEGRGAARQVIATEYGIDAADVIVSKTGAATMIAPALGATAIPGTTMVHAATPDAQVAVARNITQYFDPATNAVLETLPPASRAAAIETIVQTLSADGRPPDALALLDIDESVLRKAHADGPDAVSSLVGDKVFEVPATVLRASLAEASAARSIVSASPLHIAAVHDVSHQSGVSLSLASSAMAAVTATAETKLLTGDYTAADQQYCFDKTLSALSELTVVRSAVTTVDSAARNDMGDTQEVVKRIVVEQQAHIEMLKSDYARAQAVADPSVRLEKVNEVLLEHAKLASEVMARAERAHSSGIESVLESLGSRGSRAARKAASTDVPFS
jgi:hypothetical protein